MAHAITRLCRCHRLVRADHRIIAMANTGIRPSQPGDGLLAGCGHYCSILWSLALALAGVVAGVGLLYVCIALAQGYVQSNYGIYLPLAWPSEYEWTLLGGILAAALLMGCVPAWRAYRQSLADGLSIRL